MLEKGYEKLGRKPVVYRMNPKAMARQQLLGSMNLDTREWSDGVLTAAARKVGAGCVSLSVLLLCSPLDSLRVLQLTTALHVMLASCSAPELKSRDKLFCCV